MVTLFSAALGQAADLRLTVERTDPLELSWETAPTAHGSVYITRVTQLEASTDLIHWQPLGQAQPGGLRPKPVKVIRTIEPTAGFRYYRVRSHVFLPNAILANHNLVAADLRGANLRGANLANADQIGRAHV